MHLANQYINMGQGQARSAESRQLKSSADKKEDLKSTKNPESQARSSKTVSLLSKCREKKRERWEGGGGGRERDTEAEQK